MNEASNNNKRIAKNTIALYARMLVSVAIGLYTSRVVLSTLGFKDYGIYNVVGGIIALFGFLNGSMTAATSRFISFDIGKKDYEHLKSTFSSALIIHCLIALLVLILGETIGLWFINTQLVIPKDRIFAANWVYQMSVLAMMINFTQIPYGSCIVSHENFKIYAYVDILNSILKLLIVYFLLIVSFDKLILYSSLVLCVTFITTVIYRIYCIRKFEECKSNFVLKKDIVKHLLSFSGWNLFRNMCLSFKQQGLNIMINQFFGVALNAASGISTTVSGIIWGFSFNVILASDPQITKDYAAGRINEMQSVIINAIKISIILFSIIAVPLIFEMNYVMSLWLKDVPDYAVPFCRLMLCANVIDLINSIISLGIMATCKIKSYSIITGLILLSHLLLFYASFNCGANPDSAYIICFVMSIVILVSEFIILKKQVKEINLFIILKNVIIVLSIVLVSLVPVCIVCLLMHDSFLRLSLISIINIICVILFSYRFVFDAEMRLKIRMKLHFV